MNEKRTVYLDHAAATPLDPQVKEAMLPYLGEQYGNPSAIYAPGRIAREALDNARETVAQALNCTAAEIMFTGSGTASANLAIFGVARGYRRDQVTAAGATRDLVTKGHIITTNIEHHAVLNSCKALQNDGFEVTYLKVDHDGLVTAEQFKAAIRPDTILISIMYANNEIGTIEPIHELTRAMQERKKELGRKPNDPPFFHTDACQAAGYLDIDVKSLGVDPVRGRSPQGDRSTASSGVASSGVDLMTINGSKIYGPKGTGALFVRRGLKLQPLIYGGGQEMKLRSGTENVAGIVGLATALKIATQLRDKEGQRLIALRDQLLTGIMDRIPKVVLNGHATKRLPNNVDVSILDIEGEAMLLYLDEHGIYVSTGSACDSQALDPSHVILALGKPYEFAHGSIRFTLGRATSAADIDYVLDVLSQIVSTLRKISPVRIDVNATGITAKTAFVGDGLPHFVKQQSNRGKKDRL
ncbi:MAG: Cysteine desulfurase [Parcubacteria group bacterium GW2011_GWC2_45_7]|nr:MAG: Cysteine desulfurase [Parcubacteria group bacterium GW2011_GWC2_45_7]